MAEQKVQDLLDYVFDYYSQLMTADEQLAHKYIVHVLPHENTPPTEFELKKRSFLGIKPLMPSTRALVVHGFEAFKNQVANRILAEHGPELQINRCPKCGGICRTPLAKQCRFCFHDWHK